MASAEQPLKKRKLYDSVPDPPQSNSDLNLQQQQSSSSSSPPPPVPVPVPVPAPPPSQEEILRKRRNREEIRKLYECYRRIRFCISQKDGRYMPDFERAYLSLITASRGCTSAQRIAAELIPRYASHCPTALEAAAKVAINMYNWSLAIIMSGEDADGVAFQTAKACIFGLVDICCTASSVAPTSSVIGGICSAVFLNVLTFLISTFEDNDIYHIGEEDAGKLQESAELFSQLKEKLADDSGPPLSKLLKYRALSLLRIFFACPRNSLAVCFELFSSSTTDTGHKGGRYLLRQLTSPFNAGAVCHSLDKINNGGNPFSDSLQTSVVVEKIDEVKLKSNGKHVQEKMTQISRTCIMGMVIDKDPSLRSWIVTRFRKLCNSVSSEAVSEISSSLEEIFESFSELLQEADNQEDTEDDNSDPSKYINRQYLIPKISGHHDKSIEISGRDSSPNVRDTSSADVLYEDRDSAEKVVGQAVKEFNSAVRNGVNQSANQTSNHESEVSISTKNWEVGDYADSFSYGSSMQQDLLNNPLHSPAAQKPLNHRSDGYESGKHFIHVEKNQVSNVDLGLPAMGSVSGGAIDISPSPKQHSAMQYHDCSTNQIIWYSDGDPAAMDVFAASKQLWLGSLGHDASETLVKVEFEKFGPLVKFMFFHLKGFALVEYRNIMDAVKARQYMRGSSPWGASLRVKFLDIGLGSRGAINGAAVGSSCHVYIGKISSQWAKDEILHSLITLGLRSPRMVTDLCSDNALLLEFETAEEATTAMAHVRQHRKETGYRVLPRKSLIPKESANGVTSCSCHLFVRQIDLSVSDEQLINAFSAFGEITGLKFMRQSGCCLIDFSSLEAANIARSHLDGARFGPSSIHVEFRTKTHGNVSNSMNSSPTVPTVLSSPIDNNNARMSELSSLFASLCTKYNISQWSSTVDGYVSRNKHATSFGDEDRVPTNTLWIALPDINIPLLTDDELMAICNLAVGNSGSVARLTRGQMHRGSCWYVEFSSVDAAISACRTMRGCPGMFFQIEFRNSGIPLHQDERQLVQEKTNVSGSHDDFYSSGSESHPGKHHITPFLTKAESVTHNLVSPRTKIESHGTPLHSGNPFQSNWAICSSTMMLEVGPRNIERADSFENKMVADLSIAGGQAFQHTGEQMWIYKKPEVELQMSAPGSVQCLPTITQGPNTIRPQIQASSFMQPAYQTPNNPWDMHTPNSSTTLNQISSGMMPNNFHAGGYTVPPFLPSSVTPLAHLPGNSVQHFNQTVPVRALPPPLPDMLPPPPPDMPPPLPSSPPPLPLSQPPSVPPPPSSPPPLPQQVVGPPNSETRGYQWQGALCKSGVHYCTIYANKEESVACKYTSFTSEPAEWPARLDVTKRTDIRHVKSTFSSTPPHKREVCRLLPSAIDDHKGFQDFIAYLKQRECAGVIKIPAGKAMWARLLFILPYSLDTCSMLGIAPHPDECLIALVLPKDTNFECA